MRRFHCQQLDPPAGQDWSGWNDASTPESAAVVFVENVMRRDPTATFTRVAVMSEDRCHEWTYRIARSVQIMTTATLLGEAGNLMLPEAP